MNQLISDDAAVQSDEENPVADADGRRGSDDCGADDIRPYAFGTFFEEKFRCTVIAKDFRKDIAEEPGGI